LLTSSGEIGAQGIDYADKLYKQAQRTHRIVQNLLSFARQHKPERVAVSLNQILEDTLAMRDYDVRMSNIRVHLELAADLPPTAADPHQFQQVFLNLVNNAVDAILEKSSEGDLWVRTGAHEDVLFIEFTDSGPGVQDPSRVFDPFYTTKPVGKGTGLGLSICYGIVTEHGGTIRVKNDRPRGASFTIELPLQTVLAVATGSDAGPAKSLRTGSVLLVDEDESVLEAVGAILKRGQHRVKMARTEEQATELVLREEFDVVILDVHVPGPRNGNVFSKWLEAKKPRLAGRIIFMRAGAPETPSGAEADSEYPVLQKPFKAADLLSAVDAALAQVQAVPIHR